MKILRFAFLAWSVCITLIFAAAIFTTKHPVTETHVFCAYNRVFVEFDENGKRWGTIMLDYSGRPVPCQSDDEVKIENTI